MWTQIPPQAELSRLLHEYKDASFDTVLCMLERQFNVLHNRAHVLLTLCGIVVTTTGFSGRLIAATNRPAQILIILGVFLALLSAAVTVWRVLHLHWLTGQQGETREAWLRRCLAYREHKTRAYRVAIIIMILGLTLYVAAIALMLLSPEPINVLVR